MKKYMKFLQNYKSIQQRIINRWVHLFIYFCVNESKSINNIIIKIRILK